MEQSRRRDFMMTDHTRRLCALSKDYETRARDAADGPTVFRPLRVRFVPTRLFWWHHSSLPGTWYQQPQVPFGRSGQEYLSAVPLEQLSSSGNGCSLCSSLGSAPPYGLDMASAAVTVPKAPFSCYF